MGFIGMEASCLQATPVGYLAQINQLTSYPIPGPHAAALSRKPTKDPWLRAAPPDVCSAPISSQGELASQCCSAEIQAG